MFLKTPIKKKEGASGISSTVLDLNDGERARVAPLHGRHRIPGRTMTGYFLLNGWV
jgi:hypothetical protein